MARHTTVVLSAADKARATKARNMLAARAEGESVLVNFVKRDGSARRIEGPVVSIVGEGDHEAVVVDTIEGPRSANLWAVKSVTLMGV